MKGILTLASLALFLSIPAFAQPRPAEKSPAPNAPTTYQAKYEGGIFGSSGREKGTLVLDDANERVIFNRKDGREMFSIPYDAMVVIYPDSKVSMSQTGNVLSRVPVPGAGLFGLMSSKAQFLIINFEDPDVEAAGVANFKFDDKKMLITLIHALGSRAKMKQRGDAYYRPKSRPTF